MFKEEKFIEEKFGRANHFKVPEGYFDGFASRLEGRLHAAEDEGVSSSARIVNINSRPSFWTRYRHVVGGVAASVCIVVFSLGAFMHKGTSEPGRTVEQANISSAQQHSDSSIDEFVDYTMMDTDDMYAYMADAI